MSKSPPSTGVVILNMMYPSDKNRDCFRKPKCNSINFKKIEKDIAQNIINYIKREHEIVDVSTYIKKKLWEIRDGVCPFQGGCGKQEEIEQLTYFNLY